MFLAGLSLAVGALVASATGQLDPSRQVVPARLGLIVAALGPAAVYRSSVSQGLSAGTVRVGVAALLLAIAALTVSRRMTVFALTGTAILAWASRSHTATVGGLFGMLADAAHLGGASLWLGTLALLVVDLWRSRKGGGSLLEPARRYSHWVLRAVIVLAAAGVARSRQWPRPTAPFGIPWSPPVGSETTGSPPSLASPFSGYRSRSSSPSLVYRPSTHTVPSTTWGIMGPTCGLTRDVMWTARGDLARAWQFNPASLLVVLALIGSTIRAAFGRTTGRWLNLYLRRHPWLWIIPALLAILLAVRQQSNIDLLLANPAG